MDAAAPLVPMPESRVVQWLLAFALTQLIEVPIYAFAHRRPHRLLKAFGASAITHPVVWWVIPYIWPGGYWSLVAVSEAFAFAAEAAYTRAFRVPHAWAWSLLANSASCGAGFLVYRLLGWW